MLINRKSIFLVMTLSAAAGSAHAATFDEMDADGSGDLNLEEFEAAFSEQGQEYFDMYNAPAEGDEADDVVTPEEITAYNSANYDDGSDPALTLFAAADVNNDGIISKGEMFDHFGPEAQAALAKFDENGDGNVTLNEVRSSDNPKGERGRGLLERSAETSGARGNSGNRGEASGTRGNSGNRSEGNGRGRG